MLIKVLLILVLCLVIIVGAAYFFLWPIAQQGLTVVSTVLQPAVENVQDALPGVTPEKFPGTSDLIAVLPILERIGVERLVQIQQIAADGVTADEAQQILDILSEQLSPEEIARLKELLNLPQS